VSDVTALAALSALSSLSVNRNQVKDASPLAVLGQLTSLGLSSNRIIGPLSVLSGLAKLQGLDLSHNQMANLGSVSGLPALRVLDLGDNQLTDVSELAPLSSIYTLGLSHNQISDPHALAPLTQLVTLDLSNNSIHTLSGSFSFSDLYTLDLSNNGLSVIPETALTGSLLNTVLLLHNQLQDLSAFAHVTFHELPCERCSINAKLDLSDNQVLDLTPLLRATWLGGSTVVVTEDPLNCTAQANNLQALRARGISVDGCP
jgi:internalin A